MNKTPFTVFEASEAQDDIGPTGHMTELGQFKTYEEACNFVEKMDPKSRIPFCTVREEMKPQVEVHSSCPVMVA